MQTSVRFTLTPDVSRFCVDHGAATTTSDRAGVNSLLLTIHGGIRVSVPATLQCYTTYILLEQERWFERDIEFLGRWLTEGMHALDVGANVGVFSLPLARMVGRTGSVFAFEPDAENRRHLEAGRLANQLDSLTISPCALSDSDRDGWLQIGHSGELHTLVDVDAGAGAGAGAGTGSRVRVSTLDLQAQEYAWPAIDFVKIDAEGQEARIIDGGRALFTRDSPLVVYEIKQGATVNQSLRSMLEALGYQTYRLLGDADCLVPVGDGERLDVDTINLFAAKPDRAKSLAERDLLVSRTVAYMLNDDERRQALEGLLGLPYARALGFSEHDIFTCPYREALIAYAACRFAALSSARRYAALGFAYSVMDNYCSAAPTPSALATLVRLALALGRPCTARNVIEVLKSLMTLADTALDQPFFPPCARYDLIDPSGREADWFMAAVSEQFELQRGYSSLFTTPEFDLLKGLCKSSFSSPEMTRRLILTSARDGTAATDLIPYLNKAHMHLNAAYWTPDGLATLLALREPALIA